MVFARENIFARGKAAEFMLSLPEEWRTTESQFRPRETLLAEGVVVRGLHIIKAGWVKVSRALPDGGHRGVGFFGSGSILGMETGEHYSNSAVALTPVATYSVPLERVWLQSEGAERTLRLLTAQLAGQLAAAQNQLALLGIVSAERRLAAFLISIAGLCDKASGGELEVPMRRDDIAEFLGMRSETVSRRIVEFQRRGWIELSPKSSLRILDAAALRSFSAENGDDGLDPAAQDVL
ncbi:MAG: Crp/Fnr family transcriptional regulator [Hyphomonadaceae bacterium]